MKYLSNRDEFLKRSLNKIEEYKSIEIDLEKLNETDNSGPFANDIPWNDSLLVRLINSAIRKAKIGANLLRIKAVNRRLEDAFEDLLGSSLTAEMSDEDKKNKNKVSVFKFLEELEKEVKAGGNVGEIKRLTDGAIKNISGIEDLENKEALIKQLEDFKKFLEQFKDTEGGKEGEEGDTEELDITELVDSQKNIETKQEEYFNNLFNQLNDLQSKLGEMDNIMNKLNSLENKIEKYREKTPQEKLELRTYDSYPFSQKLSQFFDDKSEEMEKTGKNDYVLTSDEVTDINVNDIKNSFQPGGGMDNEVYKTSFR